MWSCSGTDGERKRPNLVEHNIEFSCRPKSDRYAPVLRTASPRHRPNPDGQLQRFVISTLNRRLQPERGTNQSTSVRQTYMRTFNSSKTLVDLLQPAFRTRQSSTFFDMVSSSISLRAAQGPKLFWTTVYPRSSICYLITEPTR